VKRSKEDLTKFAQKMLEKNLRKQKTRTLEYIIEISTQIINERLEKC